MRSLIIAAIVGLITAIVLTVFFKMVPAIGNLIPADWYSAVIGGFSGGFATLAVGALKKKEP